MNNHEKCQERREDIAALVLGELDSTAAGQLERHVETCEPCRGFRDGLADQEVMLRSTFDAIARRFGQVEHLAERFDESRDRPRTQAVSPLRRLIREFRAMRPSRKILAVAAAIALTFTGLASWLIPSDSRTGLAFADVLEKISIIRPYSCLLTVQSNGQPAYSRQVAYLSLSRRREVLPDGTIRVFDMSQEPVRILTLHPDRKLAVEETLVNAGPRSDPDFLTAVSRMRNGSAEDLGTKEIEGRLAQGFHRPDSTNDLTIWADATTGLPIRIELLHPTLEQRIIMSGFVFAVSFDGSLFSTEAPAGYTVQKVETDGVIIPTEHDLTEGLRVIATLFDGRFPGRLSGEAIREVLKGDVQRDGTRLSKEAIKAMQLKAERALRYINVLQQLNKVGELSYVGEGVALGDATRPVLWWKPKASETYRVVYADLSIRDVRAEDLSNVPKK